MKQKILAREKYSAQTHSHRASGRPELSPKPAFEEPRKDSHRLPASKLLDRSPEDRYQPKAGVFADQFVRAPDCNIPQIKKLDLSKVTSRKPMPETEGSEGSFVVLNSYYDTSSVHHGGLMPKFDMKAKELESNDKMLPDNIEPLCQPTWNQTSPPTSEDRIDQHNIKFVEIETQFRVDPEDYCDQQSKSSVNQTSERAWRKKLQGLTEAILEKDKRIKELESVLERQTGEFNKHQETSHREMAGLRSKLEAAREQQASQQENSRPGYSPVPSHRQSDYQREHSRPHQLSQHDSFACSSDLRHEMDVMISFFINLIDKTVAFEADRSLLKGSAYSIIKKEDVRLKTLELRDLFLETGAAIIKSHSQQHKSAESFMKSSPSTQNSAFSDKSWERTAIEMKEKCSSLEAKLQQVVAACQKSSAKLEEEARAFRARVSVLQFGFDSLRAVLTTLSANLNSAQGKRLLQETRDLTQIFHKLLDEKVDLTEKPSCLGELKRQLGSVLSFISESTKSFNP